MNKRKTINSVLGRRDVDAFEGKTIEEYEEDLRGLNEIDLISHAVKNGVSPVNNRRTLISRLKKNFAVKKNLKSGPDRKPQIIDNESKKRAEEILKKSQLS